jgi:hypothetical protein
MTSALEGGEWSASRPGRTLPPVKTWYLLYRRPGGPQGRSGQVRNISPSPGFEPRTAQPVVSRYNDWATRPTVCIFSLGCSACNAHAPYFRMWSARGYSIFPRYLINGTIFDRKFLNIKFASLFSLQLLSETFLIIRRTERNVIKCILAFT